MKVKGFKLSRKHVHVHAHAHHHPPRWPKHLAYHRLSHPLSPTGQDPGYVELVGMVKILGLGQSLSRLVRLFLRVLEQVRTRVYEGGHGPKRAPKGHVAVYVGEGEEEDLGSSQRFDVPVVYVNHPLFAELLKEVEEKRGFHHHGGISIPCPVPVFESVRATIAANSGDSCRKLAMCCKGFDTNTAVY